MISKNNTLNYTTSWPQLLLINYAEVLNPWKTGGGWNSPPWHKILFFNMKTDFKDAETSWLPQFYPNGSNGTKFSTCFFIGMGFRNRFVRNLLGENGYFIGFWHFRPNFKLLWHASKWTLCLQKCWILLIYYVVILQYNFHAHGKSLKRKTKGGANLLPPPGSGWVKNSPGLIGLME